MVGGGGALPSVTLSRDVPLKVWFSGCSVLNRIYNFAFYFLK